MSAVVPGGPADSDRSAPRLKGVGLTNELEQETRAMTGVFCLLPA
jgi:hypothetical protein